MSFYDIRTETEHRKRIVVRGPYETYDYGVIREAFQVSYETGNPPEKFEFDGMVYRRGIPMKNSKENLYEFAQDTLAFAKRRRENGDYCGEKVALDYLKSLIAKMLKEAGNGEQEKYGAEGDA